MNRAASGSERPIPEGRARLRDTIRTCLFLLSLPFMVPRARFRLWRAHASISLMAATAEAINAGRLRRAAVLGRAAIALWPHYHLPWVLLRRVEHRRYRRCVASLRAGCQKANPSAPVPDELDE